MRKDVGGQLEVFDGGVEGLFRYHRARRMLASCLLLPLLAGAMHAAHAGWIALLLLAHLRFGRSSAGYLADLAVHAGGGLSARSEKEKALLWEDIRHQLAGVALVLLTTTALLLASRQAGASAGEIRLGIAVQLCYAFMSCLCLGVRFSITDFLSARLKAASALLLIGSLCAIPLGFYEVGSGIKLAANAALLLLPPFLCLYWLAASARQSGLLQLAHGVCVAACATAFMSYAWVWKMPWFFFGFDHGGAWVERAPTAAMWLGAGLLLAYGAAASLALAFIRTERIKRGQFYANPGSLLRGSAIWWPGKHGRTLMTRWIRRHVVRAGKPFLGFARHWRRVRQVTLLGECPWPMALLSSAATLCLLHG